MNYKLVLLYMTYYEACLHNFASYSAYVKYSYIQPCQTVEHLYKKTAILAIFQIFFFSKLGETMNKYQSYYAILGHFNKGFLIFKVLNGVFIDANWIEKSHFFQKQLILCFGLNLANFHPIWFKLGTGVIYNPLNGK